MRLTRVLAVVLATALLWWLSTPLAVGLLAVAVAGAWGYVLSPRRH